jgi:predicted transcriptional regulator
LVAAKFRENFKVGKRIAQKMDIDRSVLSSLNGGVEEQYQVTVTNKFAALENLEDNGNVNKSWNTVGQNIKFSA